VVLTQSTGLYFSEILDIEAPLVDVWGYLWICNEPDLVNWYPRTGLVLISNKTVFVQIPFVHEAKWEIFTKPAIVKENNGMKYLEIDSLVLKSVGFFSSLWSMRLP
jgi:hypothetical protein